MKISHEVPLSLLDKSLEFNDYQYVLPLFWNKYPKYKEFMLEYRKQKDSFIILDNGIFEGNAPSRDELISIIYELKPNIFIPEDVWNDSKATLASAEQWMKNVKPFLPESTQLMAVLQGNSLDELILTYKHLIDLGYTHISINHSSIAYANMFSYDTPPLLAACAGRVGLIEKLIESDCFVKENYHHLLGASLVSEFSHYKGEKYDFIKSVDTSNPILVGAEGERYGDKGVNWKPKSKIEHYFEKDLGEQLEDIIFNVNKFKEFCNK